LAELNDTYPRLEHAGDDERRVNDVLDELFHELSRRKQELSADDWPRYVQSCRRHPITRLLHQDPFTHRAFSKPRGYAGDAELLDFIYGREEQWPPPKTTPLGRCVFNYTTLAPAAEGVRARRAFVAALIDRAAEEATRPHILSIAAGHFREAQLSAALRRNRLGRCLALDSDEASMREVRRCYGCYGVETLTASVRKLIAGRQLPGCFDLVYATGLFDYVAQSAARRLVSVMFRMLRAGGRLLVANFLPGIRDVGYMEAFMDWNLVYRTRQEMIDITMEIPQAEIRDIALFAEENQNILFVLVRKK
jgi:SAM-dependent methyltransferase